MTSIEHEVSLIQRNLISTAVKPIRPMFHEDELLREQAGLDLCCSVRLKAC
jgi:hypothetical protein